MWIPVRASRRFELRNTNKFLLGKIEKNTKKKERLIVSDYTLYSIQRLEKRFGRERIIETDPVAREALDGPTDLHERSAKSAAIKTRYRTAAKSFGRITASVIR